MLYKYNRKIVCLAFTATVTSIGVSLLFQLVFLYLFIEQIYAEIGGGYFGYQGVEIMGLLGYSRAKLAFLALCPFSLNKVRITFHSPGQHLGSVEIEDAGRYSIFYPFFVFLGAVAYLRSAEKHRVISKVYMAFSSLLVSLLTLFLQISLSAIPFLLSTTYGLISISVHPSLSNLPLSISITLGSSSIAYIVWNRGLIGANMGESQH